MGIIEGSKGYGKEIWQTINKLVGKQNNMDKKFELKINNILVKDSLTIATNSNGYFLNSVNEITQRSTLKDITYSPINFAQPIFQIEEVTELEVTNIIDALKSSKVKHGYGTDKIFTKI